MEEILGYYVHEGNLCAEAVYVLIDEGKDGVYTRYNPVRGKEVVSHAFKRAATPITKQQYVAAAGTTVTPVKYL